MRLLEKPTWGQVFSDTVNTGIYVMEPEVLAICRPGATSIGAPTSSRGCSPRARRSTAGIADGYWEDIGTPRRYLKAQADVLARPG